MLLRRVLALATLMAASMASLPEFQKKNVSRLGCGIIGSSDSTSCTYGCDSAMAHCTWMMDWACSIIAAVTSGCEWPRDVTPIPDVKSRSSLPSCLC